MTVNSINTNISAQVALSNLNTTNRALEETQKRVSTGQVVADAVDNGAAFAIAQGLRSDLAGLEAVNSQLANAKGLMTVTNTAAKSISDTLAEVRDVLTRMADENNDTTQFQQYNDRYAKLKATITNYIANAVYNGQNLISAGASGVNVISDMNGTQYGITAQDLKAAVSDNLTAITTAADAQALLTGGFTSAENSLGTAMNSLAADTNRLDDQMVFNSAMLDAIEQGLGAIVDADLAKESARLQALQTKQQLGIQALTIANAAPNVLLSLFRGG